MAIVTAYVYSPFSNQGRITGRTKYCITTDGSSSGCTGSGTSHGA